MYVIVPILAFTIALFLMPAIAHRILVSKYEKMKRWWYSACQSYKRHLEENPDFSPSPHDKGEVGALGIWKEDVIRTAKAGTLPRERAHMAIQIGIIETSTDCQETEADMKKHYSSRIPIPAVIITTILFTASAYACSVAGVAYLSYLPFITVLCILGMCDQSTKTLPYGLCFAEYPLALGALLLSSSTPDILPNIICALIVAGCLLAMSVIFDNSIGRGDVRLLPACALLIGPTTSGLVALCTMSFSMCIAALVLRLRYGEQFGMKSSIPMGMYILFGMICGMIHLVWKVLA